jgi:hypothetical protein
VQPGHARKMTAALQAADHQVRYFERAAGGHGGATDAAQAAFNTALRYEFLLRTSRGCAINAPETLISRAGMLSHSEKRTAEGTAQARRRSTAESGPARPGVI